MTAHPAPPSLGFSRQEHWSGLPFPSPMHESEKWKWSHSVVSNCWRPHGLQPARLLRPWDFPGKSTGVGCHSLPSPCEFWKGLKFHVICCYQVALVVKNPPARVRHDWSDLAAAAAAGLEWSLKFPEDGDVAVNIPLLSHCTRQCGFAFFSRINCCCC